MTKVSALLALLTLTACEGDGSAPIEPLPFEGLSAAGLQGTAADDLWSIRDKGKEGAGGQWDIGLLGAEHFDGEAVRPVAFPTEAFRDAPCGRPSTMVAGGRGELWMAGVKVPQCGLDPERVAGSHVLFGVLKADGAFIDFSADIEVRAPGTYQEVTLRGRGGLVGLTVRSQAPSGYRYETFFYDSDGRRPWPPMPTGTTYVSILGPEEVVAIGDAEAFRLRGGEWEALPPGATVAPPGQVTTGDGEMWAFNYGAVRQQPEQVAHRYVAGVFEEVDFLLPRREDSSWRPVALFPRAGGRFTLVGVSERYTDMNDTATRLVTRTFDGTKLSTSDEALGPEWRCAGRNDSDCPIGPLRHFVSLEDGNTILVSDNDSVHPVTYYLLRSGDVP